MEEHSLVIIVEKNGNVRLYLEGKEVEALKSVEFTGTVDSVPELKIEKYICPNKVEM